MDGGNQETSADWFAIDATTFVGAPGAAGTTNLNAVAVDRAL